MKKRLVFVTFPLLAMSVILIFQYCSENKVDVNNDITITDAYWKTFEIALGTKQIQADATKTGALNLTY